MSKHARLDGPCRRQHALRKHMSSVRSGLVSRRVGRKRRLEDVGLKLVEREERCQGVALVAVDPAGYGFGGHGQITGRGKKERC